MNKPKFVKLQGTCRDYMYMRSCKHIATTIVCIGTILLNACTKPCEKSLRIGEIVQINTIFNGFGVSEIDNIKVYRIDNRNTGLVDTFFLSNILWVKKARSLNEIITDRAYGDAQGQYGYYKSYFDNCTLIFDWHTGSDTLSNMLIKKSKEAIEGCHKDDPNVKIDQLSFFHKGKIISKGESIQINK
jgi:hypothetical protein